MKVGFKGVKIVQSCFRDESRENPGCVNCLYTCHKPGYLSYLEYYVTRSIVFREQHAISLFACL